MAGVPDAEKSERLVMLHKLVPEPLQDWLEKLAQSVRPNLWKPRPDKFFHIDAFPYPGTRKFDLRKAREIAVTKASAPP